MKDNLNASINKKIPKNMSIKDKVEWLFSVFTTFSKPVASIVPLNVISCTLVPITLFIFIFYTITLKYKKYNTNKHFCFIIDTLHRITVLCLCLLLIPTTSSFKLQFFDISFVFYCSIINLFIYIFCTIIIFTSHHIQLLEKSYFNYVFNTAFALFTGLMIGILLENTFLILLGCFSVCLYTKLLLNFINEVHL